MMTFLQAQKAAPDTAPTSRQQKIAGFVDKPLTAEQLSNVHGALVRWAVANDVLEGAQGSKTRAAHHLCPG